MAYFDSIVVGVIGSPILDSAILVGGSDGTNLQAIATDATGQVKVLVQSGTITISGTVVVSGTVTSNIGTTGGLALDATLTSGTQKTKLVDTGGVNVASISAAGAIKVDGSAVTQPISGAISFTAPQHVIVDNASIAVTGSFFQATQPVSIAGSVAVTGTFFQATQPISGAISFTAPQHVINDASAAVIGHVVTDTGSTTVVTGSVAVTGTFFQATQPVSIAATLSTDVTDRAARLLGHVTVDNASIAVTGSFFQATQPISAAALPLPAGAATSAKQPALGTAGTPSADVITVQGVTGGTALAVSLGNSVGKTNVMKTGTLTTTAVTADQVVLTYTVTALKTFYLMYFNITPRLTVAPGNSNPVNLGIASLESPSGTKLITLSFVGALAEHDTITFTEPVPIAAGTVIRAVCTPDAATSMQWIANFGGYEK